MTTVARISEVRNGHWYTKDGQSCYEVPRKDGKGMRKTTLADARELGLLPSVTHILDSVLRKPALEAWKVEQSVLACLTTPRKEGEEIDAFVKRVLSEEKVQQEEAQTARDRGTEIHQALEDLFCGKPISEEINPWVRPAFLAVQKYGELACTEKVLVGDGYAGKIDLVQKLPFGWMITDYKTTKKIPEKSAWPEAKLQLAAYAMMWQTWMRQNSQPLEPVRVQNVYISSVEPGRYVIHECEDWGIQYGNGFRHLVSLWQHLNSYQPQNANGE